MMPIEYEQISDRELDADEVEFRRKLSDLVDEALEAGIDEIVISLALALASEAIDRGTVVRLAYAARKC